MSGPTQCSVEVNPDIIQLLRIELSSSYRLELNLSKEVSCFRLRRTIFVEINIVAFLSLKRCLNMRVR